LKNSGLKNIKDVLEAFCSDKTKKSTFYIGGAGETDPKTLKELHNILKRKPNHQLIFCTPDAGIFHPKIYVFVKGKKVTIVTGSANLTEAGWVVNDEVSVVVETTVNSSEYLQLASYFGIVHKKYHTDDIEGLIERYRKALEEYKVNYPRPAFRFRRKKTTIAGIDMPRLRRYYELYQNNPKWYVIPETREAQYQMVKANLEILASSQSLSAEAFHRLFGGLVGHKGYGKLWHSGSLHRRTYETLDYADAFRSLVRRIKDSIGLPVGEAYGLAIYYFNQMRKAKPKEIAGVGENVVTEIFMSFDYFKFANLNENPVVALELLGWDYRSPESFKGDDYQEYVLLLTRIRDELKMRSFLEIDSFFNYVYWNLTEE
jgi:uncharacterized pyridoxamine 5'-phosphate oxidase family protein